jgi:hypothetical protein
MVGLRRRSSPPRRRPHGSRGRNGWLLFVVGLSVAAPSRCREGEGRLRLVAASARKGREKAAEEGSGGRDGRGERSGEREGGHVGLRQGAGRKGRGGRKREKAARRWRWGGASRTRRPPVILRGSLCSGGRVLQSGSDRAGLRWSSVRVSA